MNFSVKEFFSKYDQIRSFLKKILHGKLHFLCIVRSVSAEFLKPCKLHYKIVNCLTGKEWSMFKTYPRGDIFTH